MILCGAVPTSSGSADSYPSAMVMAAKFQVIRIKHHGLSLPLKPMAKLVRGGQARKRSVIILQREVQSDRTIRTASAR